MPKFVEYAHEQRGNHQATPQACQQTLGNITKHQEDSLMFGQGLQCATIGDSNTYTQ